MTAAQIAARLVLINDAIDFILNRKNAAGGSPVGNQYTRLDLAKLETLRTQYEAQLEAVSGTGGPGVIRFAPRET